MTTPRYLSPTNGFIPEATGQAIAFVRDPNRFKLNQYAQLIMAPKPLVVYAVLDPDQPARVPTRDTFRWAPGNYRPRGTNNMGNFVWNEVLCERFDYGYTVDYQAIDAAQGWNPRAFFNAIILQQAMTNVTDRFITMMETAGNWGTNTSDANTLNGGAGTWDQGSDDPASPNYLAIQKTILTAAKNIQLATNGMITLADMILIVSPGLAEAMANTSEIHSYLAKQERALQVLQGSDPSMVAQWGLPQPYCGMRVVVEDGVIVRELPNAAATPATTNRTWIKSDNSAIIVTRIGGINGQYGSPSSSTIQRYFYKYDMAIEAFNEPKHKLYETHVVDQFKEILAAPRSGWLITNVLS